MYKYMQPCMHVVNTLNICYKMSRRQIGHAIIKILIEFIVNKYKYAFKLNSTKMIDELKKRCNHGTISFSTTYSFVLPSLTLFLPVPLPFSHLSQGLSLSSPPSLPLCFRNSLWKEGGTRRREKQETLDWRSVMRGV